MYNNRLTACVTHKRTKTWFETGWCQMHFWMSIQKTDWTQNVPAPAWDNWFVTIQVTSHPFSYTRGHQPSKTTRGAIFLPRKTWSPFGDGKTTDSGIHPLAGCRRPIAMEGAQQCNVRHTENLPPPPHTSTRLESSQQQQQHYIQPRPFIHPGCSLPGCISWWKWKEMSPFRRVAVWGKLRAGGDPGKQSALLLTSLFIVLSFFLF